MPSRKNFFLGARRSALGAFLSFYPVTIFLLASVFAFPGCAVWKPLSFKEGPAPRPLPDAYLHYYDYPAGDFAGRVVKEEKTESYVMKRYEIPLHLPAELSVKDPEQFRSKTEELAETDRKTANDHKLRYLNRIDFYIPRNLKPGEKRPVILISPILGGNMVVDHFAKYYAGRGYLAALVHRKRTFWEQEDGIRQIEAYLRTSVIRLREAVDWLELQPEVDADRIGAFGISYGAILHSVLAAVEPRIKYHVLAMPAAPVADVIVHCPDKAITKLMREVHEKYGWPPEEVRSKLKEELRTDPLYVAPYVDREKIQVYAALFDRVVGAGRSFQLWKALGRPELRILPFGHYGGILLLPYLEAASYSSFKKHLHQNGRG